MAHDLHAISRMFSFIEVTFEHMERDPSLEATVHRWIARLEREYMQVVRARARIGRLGRKHTTVWLTLRLDDGFEPISDTSHTDAYVAISDAFRAARRQALARRPRRDPRVAHAIAA